MATFTLGLVLILTSVSARRPLSKPVALLQLGTSQSRQDEIAGSANASTIDSGVCDVGDVAVCPYSGVSCAGNQCCPGSVETAGLNFVCPSADGNGPWAGQYPPRCQLLTKVEDCLAKPEPESISWVGCYTDDSSRDLKEGPSSLEDILARHVQKHAKAMHSWLCNLTENAGVETAMQLVHNIRRRLIQSVDILVSLSSS